MQYHREAVAYVCGKKRNISTCTCDFSRVEFFCDERHFKKKNRIADWQQGINVRDTGRAQLSQWPLLKQYERDIPRLITSLIYTGFFLFHDGLLVLCHFF